MPPLSGFTIAHIKAVPLGPLAWHGSEVGGLSVFTEQWRRGGAGLERVLTIWREERWFKGLRANILYTILKKKNPQR